MSTLWDAAQNAQLEQLVAAKTPHAEIGKIMGKSPRAIKARVSRAGLSKPCEGKGRWSREEDTLLGHMYSEGVPRQRMATLFGRSLDAIKSRLRHLGHTQNDKGMPGADRDASSPRAVVEIKHREPPPIAAMTCPWELWRKAMSNTMRHE